MEAHRISPEEARQRVEAGHYVLFVDARSPDAWAKADQKLPGAIRIPADEIADHLRELPRDATIITYCT